jgi:hypothetical protein
MDAYSVVVFSVLDRCSAKELASRWANGGINVTKKPRDGHPWA